MAGSREVKGEAVGQGQGKGVSDRDNFTDPGESVTTSEVGGGINSKEEGEKGIRVELLFKRETRERVCVLRSAASETVERRVRASGNECLWRVLWPLVACQDLVAQGKQ